MVLCKLINLYTIILYIAFFASRLHYMFFRSQVDVHLLSPPILRQATTGVFNVVSQERDVLRFLQNPFI